PHHNKLSTTILFRMLSLEKFEELPIYIGPSIEMDTRLLSSKHCRNTFAASHPTCTLRSVSTLLLQNNECRYHGAHAIFGWQVNHRPVQAPHTDSESEGDEPPRTSGPSGPPDRLDAAGLRYERYGLEYKSNLVGQAYDGASVMSGKHSGVQARIKEVAKQALVPGSDLTAYRSYCVTALLIRHKLPKEAVVEFQGRFFVDCGSNPLTNLYSDLQRLRKKYLPQEPGAAVDETPSSSETPSTSTGPASLPTPPVTVGIQWDRFLEVFPSSLHSVAPSQAMGRQATQPTKEAVRRALTKERWVSNTPSVQGVVGGWVAPRDAPTSSQSLIRSVSEQSWRGLAVRDFGGSKGKGVVATCPMDKGDVVCDYHGTLMSDAEGRGREQSGYRFFFKELCIDASSRCDCHPEASQPKAQKSIKVGEELLWDYGVTRASFGGEGKDLAWLDM
ncbi:hypothetical protein KUCAC02_026982, partial [Chaenocephalus aceratus]